MPSRTETRSGRQDDHASELGWPEYRDQCVGREVPLK